MTKEYLKSTFKNKLVQLQIKLCLYGIVLSFFLGLIQYRKFVYDNALINFIGGFIAMKIGIERNSKLSFKKDLDDNLGTNNDLDK